RGLQLTQHHRQPGRGWHDPRYDNPREAACPQCSDIGEVDASRAAGVAPTHRRVLGGVARDVVAPEHNVRQGVLVPDKQGLWWRSRAVRRDTAAVPEDTAAAVLSRAQGGTAAAVASSGRVAAATRGA